MQRAEAQRCTIHCLMCALLRLSPAGAQAHVYNCKRILTQTCGQVPLSQFSTEAYADFGDVRERVKQQVDYLIWLRAKGYR